MEIYKYIRRINADARLEDLLLDIDCDWPSTLSSKERVLVYISEELEELRQCAISVPKRHGARWSNAEESYLEKNFREELLGEGNIWRPLRTWEIAKRHHRNCGSVRKRIIQLGLVDPIVRGGIPSLSVEWGIPIEDHYGTYDEKRLGEERNSLCWSEGELRLLLEGFFSQTNDVFLLAKTHKRSPLVIALYLHQSGVITFDDLGEAAHELLEIDGDDIPVSATFSDQEAWTSFLRAVDAEGEERNRDDWDYSDPIEPDEKYY